MRTQRAVGDRSNDRSFPQSADVAAKLHPTMPGKFEMWFDVSTVATVQQTVQQKPVHKTPPPCLRGVCIARTCCPSSAAAGGDGTLTLFSVLCFLFWQHHHHSEHRTTTNGNIAPPPMGNIDGNIATTSSASSMATLQQRQHRKRNIATMAKLQRWQHCNTAIDGNRHLLTHGSWMCRQSLRSAPSGTLCLSRHSAQHRWVRTRGRRGAK